MERFQIKKPNKEDHKRMDKAADVARNGAAALAAIATIGKLVKDHREEIVGLAKKVIKR